MEEEPTTSGRIHHIEVENFKSYRGHQTIGPFYDFTAVIGPNGSGKSNLMDAISFVLGVKTVQLRGSLKELLYYNSGGTSMLDKPRRGYVKLVFLTKDGEEVNFCRVITPSGTSEDATYQSQYRLNDRNVGWEAYNEKLMSFNILVKARNFLVFQGDIESVAAMSPTGLTQLFEHISGSERYKKQYEELEALKSEAEERTAFASQKKRAIMAEKKQKLEQKQEAEKHQRLQRELENVRTDFYLWRLYHIQREMRAAESGAQAQRVSMQETAQALKRLEDQVEGRKKAVAGLAKERLLAERALNKRRAELERKNPDSVKAKEEMSRLAKRVKAGEKEAAAKLKEATDLQEKVAKLKKDLQDITAAQGSLDEELRQGGGLQLNESQRAEFYRIQEQAGAKTARLNADLRTLETTQSAELDKERNSEDLLASISVQAAQLEKEREELKAKLDATTQAVQAGRKALKEKKAAQTRIADSTRKLTATREQLEVRLQQLDGQLRDAKADRYENERDRKISEAVEQMKRLFPGVYGRVTDMATVSQRRYNLALAVVLGRDMDSVLVDTERTAKDCIQHLKQNRVPPLTFIPVTTVKAKPVDNRLRQLGGTAKLALDLLDFEPHLERGFMSVCGNTLVCDTVGEAKRLAFAGPERHKVVSVDGTLFAKSGNITGGMGNLEARAARWDESAVKGLKQERAKVREDLEGLPSARASAQQSQSLASEIAGLEGDVTYKQADITATAEKLRKVEADLEALEAEKAKRVPGGEGAKQSLRERAAKIETLRARIQEIEDRMFDEFSVKVGVPNIREHMRSHAAAEEKLQAQRLKLAAQAAKLQSQLRYEEKRDVQGALETARAALERDKATLASLQEKERALEAQAESMQEVIGREAEKVKELAERVAGAEEEVKAAKKEALKVQSQGISSRRALQAEEANLEALKARLADVLESAAMEQVELPRKGVRRKPSGEDVDMVDAEAEEEAEEERMEMNEDAENADPNVAGGDGADLDFSRLKRHLTAVVGADEQEKIAEEFKADIEQRAASLAKAAPNLKAAKQYEETQEREKQQTAELDAARAETKRLTDEFNAVRQQRYDAFTGAFEHVAGVIDGIFKDLTRSHVHPLGGQAYLSLESAEDPFLHGIKYIAMPPSKRYREMELLSGGEKTLSALALLFAIHNYQPSPFFVLDEIDAALDAANVSRVAKYIRERTRPDAAGHFQSIVISLKDLFFHNADALIGVCRNAQLGCSATLTFDLNRYGKQG